MNQKKILLLAGAGLLLLSSGPGEDIKTKMMGGMTRIQQMPSKIISGGMDFGFPEFKFTMPEMPSLNLDDIFKSLTDLTTMQPEPDTTPKTSYTRTYTGGTSGGGGTFIPKPISDVFRVPDVDTSILNTLSFGIIPAISTGYNIPTGITQTSTTLMPKDARPAQVLPTAKKKDLPVSTKDLWKIPNPFSPFKFR